MENDSKLTEESSVVIENLIDHFLVRYIIPAVILAAASKDQGVAPREHVFEPVVDSVPKILRLHVY